MFIDNSCDKIGGTPEQVRKNKPTRRSVSGQYAFRGDRAIPFESTLERDFIYRNEYQLSVLDIIPQPVELPFKAHNGQNYTYTPDFLVYYRLGTRTHENYPKPLLVEVKPESEWRKHWKQWRYKWKAARRYAKYNGWEFRVYDESRIRDQVLQNIKYIDRFKRTQCDQQDLNLILDTVKGMGSCKIDYILSRNFPGIYRNEGYRLVMHLISNRKLECDILIKPTDQSEIWIAEDGL